VRLDPVERPGQPDPAALVTAAAGASVWTSWVVNLLVVEWWVLRPPGRRSHRAV
jgi:hypothetical protein